MFREQRSVKIENEQIKYKNNRHCEKINEIRRKINIVEQQNLGTSFVVIINKNTQNQK